MRRWQQGGVGLGLADNNGGGKGSVREGEAGTGIQVDRTGRGSSRVNHGLKYQEEALREFHGVLSLRLGLQEI